MPNDGGALLLKPNERDALLREEQGAGRFIRRIVGSNEFIKGIQRYCLWLRGASPAELHRLPQVLRRVQRVAEHRRESPREQTQDLAATPTLFGEDRQPDTRYILIPSASSERRNYIPIGFMEPEVIVSNLCLTIQGGDLYTFGVLTSALHMAWVRTVGGRLEGRYRYSNNVVYNNFPWPRQVSDRQRQRVVNAAQEILDARARYPDSTFTVLYDPADNATRLASGSCRSRPRR